MKEEADSSALDSTAAMERVSCTTCQREIPVSAAVSTEATDYVVHFCGLECFDRWRNALSDV